MVDWQQHPLAMGFRVKMCRLQTFFSCFFGFGIKQYIQTPIFDSLLPPGLAHPVPRPHPTSAFCASLNKISSSVIAPFYGRGDQRRIDRFNFPVIIPLLMKVFALISGGKDSIFNIHKCIQQGHQIVALGNLYNYDESSQAEGAELDSYMYQTVGTNITKAIAEAMGKPLYRRIITGKAKITTLEYSGEVSEREGDEVEDLYELILEAKKQHPQINAVSTGAIFSTYQKLRVQNVCARFGMTSLAYLWQRDQPELLQEMIDYPLHAIIIKIASYGLKPQHLGKSLAELQDYFMKMKEECGMNVCGEGGEFESLVLDCPLFQKKIVIDQSEVVEVEKNEIAPVAYMLVKSFHLEAK